MRRSGFLCVVAMSISMSMAIASAGCAGFEFPELGDLIGRPQVANRQSWQCTIVSGTHEQKARELLNCAQYVGPLICRVLGPVTKIEDINFNFDVDLNFQNPNTIPLPVVSALFGFQAFPGSKSDHNPWQCLSIDVRRPPTIAPKAQMLVHRMTPEIRNVKDFASAATGFLISTALGENKFSDPPRSYDPRER